MHELIVDSFAGGGGASTGIAWATGRAPDIAINHDDEALAMHAANHPETRHLNNNVWKVDPIEATGGRPVGLLWASPDCKHFSKAKGKKPVKRHIRDLAWVVVRWAKQVRPRVICVENVEEFRDWGPIGQDGKPCPNRKGQTFQRWVAELRRLGYRVEWRELRARDYGAPTVRKRLFLVARCDGLPIRWPGPTHGLGRVPYRTAADIIDWSLPCPSIFLSKEEGRRIGVKRPLEETTMARIAKGVQRFVVEAAEPFIVPLTHHGAARIYGLDEPVRTITAAHRGELALIAPFLTYAQQGGAVRDVADPVHTITASRKDCNSLVAAFLVKYYSAGGGQAQDCRDPLHTVPTRDRFGLVTVHGQPYRIVDIGMRMLTPRELFRAQGFPDSYIIDRGPDGKPLTKTASIRMCGNSVCPQVAEAIVRANYTEAEIQTPTRRARPAAAMPLFETGDAAA